MVRVKVKNNLPFTVQIKEGNDSVFVVRALLRPTDGEFILDLDPNATFREFVLIILPNNTQLPRFSADDVDHFKEIVLKEVSGNENNPIYGWVGDPEDNVPPGNDQSLTLFQKAKKIFRIK